MDCPLEDAFQLFTERLADWWPLASHSLAGNETESCHIEPWEGGRVFERTRSGDEYEWGSVTAWDPPRHVEFTWQPASRNQEGQRVTVDFRVEADGTRVTLTHYGWQLAGVATCMANAYASPALTLRFAEFVCREILVAA